MTGPIVVILNPAARRGRSSAAQAAARAAFEPLGADFQTTSGAGEEEPLARAAAASGADTIVAVGGDGTWGNVAHGIYASGVTPRLALLAAGTGNDFAKSVGVPAADPAATAQLVAGGAERRVDVGLADGRVFLNCFGVGFDTAVLARVPRIPLLRGGARYVAAALTELFRYRGRTVVMQPATGPAGGNTLLAVVANGAWFGGAFQIAPEASPDDGLLDAVRIGDVRGLRRLALLAAVMRGRHARRSGVGTLRAPAFTFSFDEPPLINTDGEVRLAENATVQVRILPRWLRLVAEPHTGSGARDRN